MKDPSNEPKKQEAVTLEKVAKQFASFRQTHQKGTRIPQELREAVEKLAEEGISLTEVLPSCGLTLWQYQRWHKSQQHSDAKKKKQKSEPSESTVRVFPVVNEDSGHSNRNQELELRLGPWSVSIKLAESSKSTNRGPACFQ